MKRGKEGSEGGGEGRGGKKGGGKGDGGKGGEKGGGERVGGGRGKRIEEGGGEKGKKGGKRKRFSSHISGQLSGFCGAYETILTKSIIIFRYIIRHFLNRQLPLLQTRV